MALIYFVRHAENRANVERVLSHKVVDYSLTERGTQQARAVAAWFQSRPVAAVYTSPLKRARETAAQIAAITGAPIMEAEALRELAVGEIDGRHDVEAWDIHDGVIARWRAGELAARFPGGESAEEVHARLAAFIAEVVERYPQGDVAVVGHGGVFRFGLPRVCVVPGGDVVLSRGLLNAAVTVLRHDGHPQTEFTCDLWGSVDHLPPEASAVRY